MQFWLPNSSSKEHLVGTSKHDASDCMICTIYAVSSPDEIIRKVSNSQTKHIFQ